MLGVSAAMKVTAVIFSAGAVMKNDDGLLKGSMLFQIIGGILKFFFRFEVRLP